MSTKENKSSKAGGVFIILFGLFFAGMGLAAMLTVINQEGMEDGDPVWVGVAVASVFVLVGLGIIIGGIYAIRASAYAAKLAQQYPDKPWLLEKKWTDGRIKDGNFVATIGVSLIAIFWNFIAWSATIGIFFQDKPIKDNAAYVVLIFPVIGLGLIAAAFYQFMRWKKFGTSIFEMAEVPGVIGGNLGGVVMTKVNVRPAEGFKLTLRCVHQWTTGSGKNSSTHKETLWESEQLMEEEAMPDDPRLSALPILFFIPYSCKPTERISSRAKHYWELEVSAKTPGIDYSATFEVPVFKTKDSDANATAPTEDAMAAGVTQAPPPALSTIRGLTVRPSLDGGELLEFKAGRHFWMLIVPTLVGVGMFVGSYFVWTRSNVTMFVPIVMLLMGLLVIAGVGSSLLTYVRVILHDDRIDINSRMFGIGKQRSIPRNTITHVDTKQGMSSGNVVYYNIIIRTNVGKDERISTLIKGKREADAFAAYLTKE